jgi:hypothetical protein
MDANTSGAEIDARLKALIEQLAERTPADDITDAEIDREVQAVRRAWVPVNEPSECADANRLDTAIPRLGAPASSRPI